MRRVGQGSGVSDLTAFGHGLASGQRDSRGVDRICNGSDSRNRARHQVLEVAASRTSDGGGDGRTVVVNVVSWCIDHNGTNRLASLDGDHRAIAQSDSHRRLRRVGQGSGVSDLTAFGHGLASGQRDSRGVDRICNRGNRRRRARHQILEVAASRASDGGGDGRTVVVDVVRRRIDHYSASRLASLDRNHRAIAQSDSHRCLRRVGQGGGIGDLTAFGHGVARRQRHGGGVDGIGDLGHGRVRVDVEHQIIAAGGAGDVDADLAWVDVRAVICSQRYVNGAGCLARNDGDHCAVGQGDAQVAGGRLSHSGGVGKYAAGFGNGWGRAQGQRRGL